MSSESIFKIIKNVGAALGAIAGFVLACFGIKKEFDENDKKLEKLDKIPDETPEDKK